MVSAKQDRGAREAETEYYARVNLLLEAVVFFVLALIPLSAYFKSYEIHNNFIVTRSLEH